MREFWLGWRGSNARNAGVKVLCLNQLGYIPIHLFSIPSFFGFVKMNLRLGNGTCISKANAAAARVLH